MKQRYYAARAVEAIGRLATIAIIVVMFGRYMNSGDGGIIIQMLIVVLLYVFFQAIASFVLEGIRRPIREEVGWWNKQLERISQAAVNIAEKLNKDEDLIAIEVLARYGEVTLLISDFNAILSHSELGLNLLTSVSNSLRARRDTGMTKLEAQVLGTKILRIGVIAVSSQTELLHQYQKISRL